MATLEKEVDIIPQFLSTVLDTHIPADALTAFIGADAFPEQLCTSQIAVLKECPSLDRALDVLHKHGNELGIQLLDRIHGGKFGHAPRTETELPRCDLKELYIRTPALMLLFFEMIKDRGAQYEAIQWSEPPKELTDYWDYAERWSNDMTPKSVQWLRDKLETIYLSLTGNPHMVATVRHLAQFHEWQGMCQQFQAIVESLKKCVSQYTMGKELTEAMKATALYASQKFTQINDVLTAQTRALEQHQVSYLLCTTATFGSLLNSLDKYYAAAVALEEGECHLPADILANAWLFPEVSIPTLKKLASAIPDVRLTPYVYQGSETPNNTLGTSKLTTYIKREKVPEGLLSDLPMAWDNVLELCDENFTMLKVLVDNGRSKHPNKTPRILIWETTTLLMALFWV